MWRVTCWALLDGKGRVWSPGGLEDRLDLDLDADLLADKDSAGLERDVPGDAEVLAVHLRLGREHRSLSAPGVAGVALEGHLERDLAGHAVDGQVAEEDTVSALPLRALAAERGFGVLLDIEQLG